MAEAASRRKLGWMVHLYTASGAVFGVMALRAIAEHDASAVFLWMIVATFIDSTDGWMARRLDLRRLIPRIDGRRLDDVVDYFTYVVVPVAFLVHFGLLPSSPWVFAAPLVASALGFANEQAKTPDDFFLGFPSYWNVVAIYLWLFGLPAWANAAVVGAISVLVLVPTRYIYPSKTRPWRAFTLAFCTVWGLQLLLAFAIPERLPSWWLWSSLSFPAYYFFGSFFLHWREPAPDC